MADNGTALRTRCSTDQYTCRGFIELRCLKALPTESTNSPPGTAPVYHVDLELFSKEEFVEMWEAMTRNMVGYWTLMTRRARNALSA